MTNSHSPGPWRFVKGPGQDWAIVDADGNKLLSDATFDPVLPALEADWRILATAPRLLSALRGLLPAHWNSLSLREKNRRLEDAHAAVAEATGRPTPE